MIYRIKKRVYNLGCVGRRYILLSCVIFFYSLIKKSVSADWEHRAQTIWTQENLFHYYLFHYSLLNVRVRFFSTFAIITSKLWWRNEHRPAVCRNKLSWNCVYLNCVEWRKHWATYFFLGNFSAWLVGLIWQTVAASKWRIFPSVTSPTARKLLNP